MEAAYSSGRFAVSGIDRVLPVVYLPQEFRRDVCILPENNIHLSLHGFLGFMDI